MASYITQTDLENALGKGTVSAIYDDDADGEAEAGAIQACCDYASVEVDSVLVNEYSITLPLAQPIPSVVKYAALDFGIAYSMRRRPDIVHAMNEKSWTDFRDAANSKLRAFASAFERLPKVVDTPANVGGYTPTAEPRIITAAPDGTSNRGDF